MQNSVVETLIGAIVIAVACLFLAYAYTTTGTGSVSGYDLLARFNRVDGISVGTDVRMSGIKVGTVSKLELDPKTFVAIAHLSIAKNVEVPDDSAVKITSEGLLGSQYLSIEPGGGAALKNGGEIENTQGSIDLIGLVSRFMFSGGASSSSTSSSSGAQTPAPQSSP